MQKEKEVKQTTAYVFFPLLFTGVICSNVPLKVGTRKQQMISNWSLKSQIPTTCPSAMATPQPFPSCSGCGWGLPSLRVFPEASLGRSSASKPIRSYFGKQLDHQHQIEKSDKHCKCLN